MHFQGKLLYYFHFCCSSNGGKFLKEEFAPNLSYMGRLFWISVLEANGKSQKLFLFVKMAEKDVDIPIPLNSV